MIRFVYLIRRGTLHKIGVSHDPEERLWQVAPGGILIHFFVSDNAYEVESALHRRFAHLRAPGDHGREWFHLAPEDVTLIRALRRVNTIEELPPSLVPPPISRTTMKVDAEILRQANTVASFRGMKLYDYLNALLSEHVGRDYRGIVAPKPEGQS